LAADALKAKGLEITCVEVDHDLCEQLVRRGHHAVQTPAELDDDSVDRIYSLNVLEHIDDDIAALNALTPKLRRGGRCLIYVPAFPKLLSEIDRQVGHHRRYTGASLRSVIEDAGLRIERLAYADSPGFLGASPTASLGEAVEQSGAHRHSGVRHKG